MQLSPTPSSDAIAVLEAARRLDRRLSDAVDGALEDLALTSSLYLALEALDSESRIHGSQLARNLRITRQSTHALLTKLRYADLIELLPLDLGVRGLVLTSTGRRRLTMAREALADVLSPLKQELPPDDLTRLLELMEGVAHALRPRPRPWWFG